MTAVQAKPFGGGFRRRRRIPLGTDRPWKGARQSPGRLLPKPAWIRGLAGLSPNLDLPATLAGTTSHFRVSYASVLGQAGQQIAEAVLSRCEPDYETLAGFFAHQSPIHFNVILAPLSKAMDGTGGAYHQTPFTTQLYCDVRLTPEPDPRVSSALVVNQAAEVFEALQKGGWSCRASNGEGLARVLASELYPGVLESLGYSTATAWLNSRRPNLVAHALRTDGSPVGTGCAVLFLNYLHSQLGFGWDRICQAASPTLEGTYRALTGRKHSFPAFEALLADRFPRRTYYRLQTDNPFPITPPQVTQSNHSAATSAAIRDGGSDGPPMRRPPGTGGSAVRDGSLSHDSV